MWRALFTLVACSEPSDVVVGESMKAAGGQSTGDLQQVWTFKGAPVSLDRPATHRLELVAHLDGRSVDPGEYTFESSDPTVLSVSEEGLLTTVSAGRVYITADGVLGMAMVEIEVH